MFDTFRNRLEITGILTTVTALRISAGRSTDPLSVDLPVMKDVLNRPFIPGSSFKGALRSRLESFVRAVHPDLAQGPAVLTEPETRYEINRIKENNTVGNRVNDERLTAALLASRITDVVSHVFGAPWLAGKVQISDLTVLSDYWFGQYQERNGVAIDRDTETASGGKLYEFQVVPPGTPFQFRAVLENAANWELGLLMLGLHQLQDRQIPLGGGRSRGLGVVELQIDEMRWIDVRSPDSEAPNPEAVLAYIRQVATGNDEPRPGENVTDDAALHDAWVAALIAELRQRSQSLASTPS